MIYVYDGVHSVELKRAKDGKRAWTVLLSFLIYHILTKKVLPEKQNKFRVADENT